LKNENSSSGKRKSGRFGNLISFHIGKEQETMKHYFLGVKPEKKELFSE